jgi:hypothetical protein
MTFCLHRGFCHVLSKGMHGSVTYTVAAYNHQIEIFLV